MDKDLLDHLRNARPTLAEARLGLTRGVIQPPTLKNYAHPITKSRITASMRTGSKIIGQPIPSLPLAITCYVPYSSRPSGSTVHFNASSAPRTLTFQFTGDPGLNLTSAVVTGDSNFSITSIVPSLPALAPVAIHIQCTVGTANGTLTVHSNGVTEPYILYLANL